MTEDEMDLLAAKIAAAVEAKREHFVAHYSGPKADLAETVTAAIRDAVRRGQLPKNILTAL